MPVGTRVRVICTVQGETVTRNGGTSAVWDRIDEPAVGYVADIYVDTGDEPAPQPPCPDDIPLVPTPEASDPPARPAPPSPDPLDQLRAECEAGDYAACDQLYSDSPVGSDYEYFGSTCGERFDFELWGSCADYDFSRLDQLWAECEAGIYAACDQLYSDSPVGSDYEYFGSTCGYTADRELAGTCEDYYVGH